MSNSVIVKTENDLHQHNSAPADARQLPEAADAPVHNETKPNLLPPPPSASSIAGEPARVAAPATPAAISQPAQNAKKLRFVQTAATAQQLVQSAKKLPVVVPRFSPAVSSQLRPHQQQQRPPRLLGNFHRILRTPTRVFRVVTPSGSGGGDNQQCKQNIGTGNCQPAPPAVATNVSATAPVAATATPTKATTAAAATATASTTPSSNSSKTIWKMRVNGKQHWPKVSPSQRASHIAMSSPRHPSYIIRAQASDDSPQQNPKQQQQTEQPNNLLGMDSEEMKRQQQQKQKEVQMNVGGQWRTYRGDEVQGFVPVKASPSATTVTASPVAAVTVVAPCTVMATSPSCSSATVSLAPAQAASTSAAATTSGEIAAGDALVAVMDGTGLRRSQRKAGCSNGGAAGLLTIAGTSTKDELRRNDSGGAVSDVLAAVRPKRMSILNKQLNYADGDESEGSGIVPTARPSQIGVGQQFQAELPEDGDQQQQQQQRPQAVQTTANASSSSSSSREDLVDRDECLWSSTEFNSKLVELKDLEVFCDVVRRHSKLDIEKALHLLNSFSFSQPFALCNLEKFACSNGKKATKWPESMDEQLIDLLNKHGKNFGKIAKNLASEWNGPQAELVRRYYALKSERCFSSNSAQFVRCPHIKILGPPVELSDRRPVARTKCANCTQKLWRDPATVGAEWRGRRRPPVLCPPCELYARKQKMHRPAQLSLEDDPNYDVKAQKPAPPDARHDDGNAASGGGGTVAEGTPRQQQRRQRHDDCKCMLARAVATRVQQQQLAQLQRRRSLEIIKQELPPTPEGSTNGVAEAEADVQNDDDNNNNSGWPDEMKQRCAKAFLTEGKNFEAIAASLGGTKSADDIADFYSEHQFTLRLDYIISLHARAKNDERNVPTLRATARNGQQKQQQQKAKALAGKKRKKNKKVPPVKKVIAKREVVGKRGECVRQAETGRNSVEREETAQKQQQQQQQANGAGGGEEMTAFDEFLAAFDRNRKRNDNDGTH